VSGPHPPTRCLGNTQTRPPPPPAHTHPLPAPCPQVSHYTQLEEPVYSAELTAPLPVPTSTAAKQQQQPRGAAAVAAVDEEELDSEVALKLDAACLSVFTCLSGVLERCVVLTGTFVS